MEALIDLSQYSIAELMDLKYAVDEELKHENSDQRSSNDLKEIALNVIKVFPECNGIVLNAAFWRGPSRFVYGFEEVEESKWEGSWMEEIDESLVTVNSWLQSHREKSLEQELALAELLEANPALYEMEIDWEGMDEDVKSEMLLLKNGEYV